MANKRKYFVGQVYKVPSEEFTIPYEVNQCDFFRIGEGYVDVGRLNFYSRFSGVKEIFPPAGQNQCDGCCAGIPLINGTHRMGKEGGYPDKIACTAYLYKRDK